MLSHYQKEGRCLVCDIIAYERRDGLRIVAENNGFVTVVPFAATAPCEMWLLPKRHQADFGDLQNGEIELLAIALRDALLRLSSALDNPPYNYVIDTATNSEIGSAAPALAPADRAAIDGSSWLRARIRLADQPFSAGAGRSHPALVRASVEGD